MTLPMGLTACLKALCDIINKKTSTEIILSNLKIQLDEYKSEGISFTKEIKQIHKLLKSSKNIEITADELVQLLQDGD